MVNNKFKCKSTNKKRKTKLKENKGGVKWKIKIKEKKLIRGVK